MVRVRTANRLSPEHHRQVIDFLDTAHVLDCARLNDHLRLDLAQGPREGFVAALAEDDAGTLVGYGQASTGNDGYVIDGIVLSEFAGDVDEAHHRLLTVLLGELPAEAAVTWWAHPDEASAAIARRLGMQPDRRLLMMMRPLPIEATTHVALRPFRQGADEAAWLEVNNAAFAEHAEQGGWDIATLRQRQAEPWFDASGFLLHERDGRLAAFCWVKIHPAADGEAPTGEIYVIAVHPDFHGQGLGRELTVAGLLHMSEVGARTAMLYVDAANTAAVRLYEQLGFTIATTEQSYRRTPLEP